VLSASALECVRGERRLFTGVGFELAPRTLLEVRGANGSGKTTLLRTLCGLLAPAAGKITWDARPIAALREEYHARIVYLGHLTAVKDELTALENLRFAARLAAMPSDAGAAANALDSFGLGNFRHQPCKTLSQGQRRRVALARLRLAAARPLWILDEPFTALDAAAVQLVRSLIESHLAAGGMVVLTTHQEVQVTAHSRARVELGA
jgi:heme exporter protein A